MMEWMCEFRSAMDFWVSGLLGMLEMRLGGERMVVVSYGEGIELYSRK
jgi:hypothetical protein